MGLITLLKKLGIKEAAITHWHHSILRATFAGKTKLPGSYGL